MFTRVVSSADSLAQILQKVGPTQAEPHNADTRGTNIAASCTASCITITGFRTFKERPRHWSSVLRMQVVWTLDEFEHGRIKASLQYRLCLDTVV